MLRAIGFACLLIGLGESRVLYSGEQVINCQPANSTVYQQLLDTVDVWGARADRTIDIRVNSQEKRFVESLLDGCKIVIDDLAEFVRMDEANNVASRSNASADWFENYHTYEELDSWYQNLATENRNFITYSPIGSTHEGNTIKALKISVSNNPSRPNIYMQAQIHAREWIAGATANYIVNQLVEDYKNGRQDVVNLLNDANIHLIPVLNIDGYKYTWSTERLWRKNRSPSTISTCIGTDVNRNYADHWGQGGSSTNPCSDTYMGPYVASELETQATQNYFLEVSKQSPVFVGVDWHSYSELVLRPYGWTSENSPDEAVLKAQGDAYVATILATSGQAYTSQKSIDLYVTTGTASDWFYGVNASEFNEGFRCAGYTVELRPKSSPPGFVLPPAEIIPTGNENYRAIIPFLSYFLYNPLYFPQ